MFSSKSSNTQEPPVMEQASIEQDAISLPLFFTQPAPVHKDRHDKAGIRLNMNAVFARPTNSIPVNVTEFIEAAKHFPIVFTLGDEAFPVVIVSLEQENYFISEKGDWMEGVYAPAYVRKYPFALSETQGSDQMTLYVDEAAPHLARNGEGENIARMFNDEGKPSIFTQNALAFCGAFQKEHLLTRRFCEEMLALDLLVAQRSEATLPQGRSIRLAGFRMIDQEKFSKLPDDKILELHHQGFLALIQYSFLAATNWRKLLDLAAKKEGNHTA